MKIGQTPDLPAGSPAAPKKAAQDKDIAPASQAQEGARAPASTGASVSVSTLARTLEQADRGTGADFDSVKVDAIKSAIDAGTYKVNPEAIADKLLANASEMLSVSRKQ